MRFASWLAGLGLMMLGGCFEDPPPPQDDTTGSTTTGSTTTGCEPGSLGCACFPNGTCNAGLACNLGVCEPQDDTTSTSSSTTDPTTGSSSSSGDPTTTAADTSSSGGSSSESSTGGGPAHILFTTSTQHTGLEVGGLAGADAICTALGQDLRNGRWVALLRDAVTPLDIRITITGDVENTVGEILAANEPELLSGMVQNLPGYDELGAVVDGSNLVWTGSLTDDCVGWSTDDPMFLGTVGLPSSTDMWLDTDVPLPCSAAPRLYCISQ